MTKLIITIFLIAIINSVAEFFLPWWILAIVCFAICYVAKLTTKQSFFAGFLGISMSWLILILLKDISNHHILSTRLANLFSFGGNYFLFILVNVLIGGFVGGLSGLCGKAFQFANNSKEFN